jgi:hypothetical protein
MAGLYGGVKGCPEKEKGSFAIQEMMAGLAARREMCFSNPKLSLAQIFLDVKHYYVLQTMFSRKEKMKSNMVGLLKSRSGWRLLGLLYNHPDCTIFFVICQGVLGTFNPPVGRNRPEFWF